ELVDPETGGLMLPPRALLDDPEPPLLAGTEALPRAAGDVIPGFACVLAERELPPRSCPLLEAIVWEEPVNSGFPGCTASFARARPQESKHPSQVFPRGEFA